MKAVVAFAESHQGNGPVVARGGLFVVGRFTDVMGDFLASTEPASRKNRASVAPTMSIGMIELSA